MTFGFDWLTNTQLFLLTETGCALRATAIRKVVTEMRNTWWNLRCSRANGVGLLNPSTWEWSHVLFK